MTQQERLDYLVAAFKEDSADYKWLRVENDEDAKRTALRSLMNIRMPKPLPAEVLAIQDEYLREETSRKGITDLADLEPVQKGIYLWQGDITTLKCDAIVNAANSQLLGCFNPCHGCIDNAIPYLITHRHTNAIPYLITHRHTTSFKASA